MDEQSNQPVDDSGSNNVFEAAAKALGEVRDLVVNGAKLAQLMDDHRRQVEASVSEASHSFQESSEKTRKEVEGLLENFTQESEKTLRKVNDLVTEVGIAQSKVLGAREDIQQLSRELREEVRLGLGSVERATNWTKTVLALSAINLVMLLFLLLK